MTPQELIDLGELKAFPATIVAPNVWTCNAGKGRAIDYFLVSDTLRGMVKSVYRIEGLPIGTHWGVGLTLKRGAGSTLVQQMCLPKPLPQELPMGAPRPPPSYDEVLREAALVKDQEDLTRAYAIWVMQAEKEPLDRYQVPPDQVRRFQGRGDLDKPKLKLVAAIRSTPKAVAEGSQLSRWWRKAGNTCIDLALAHQKGMSVTSKFILDRFAHNQEVAQH